MQRTSQRAHGLTASRRRWLMMTSWQDARDSHPAAGSEHGLEVAGAQREFSTREASFAQRDDEPGRPVQPLAEVGGENAQLRELLGVAGSEVRRGLLDAGSHARDTREGLPGETVDKSNAACAVGSR